MSLTAKPPGDEMNYRDRYKSAAAGEEVDPMGSLVNLFDVAMVNGSVQITFNTWYRVPYILALVSFVIYVVILLKNYQSLYYPPVFISSTWCVWDLIFDFAILCIWLRFDF